MDHKRADVKGATMPDDQRTTAPPEPASRPAAGAGGPAAAPGLIVLGGDPDAMCADGTCR
ncbi:hypothetical protein [Sphaerisporangium dianthi]|uniref:Uncharacterized protein n=1 Tax=Sphaerisporangium dianthi TaxID=1436120 RepID=A0ABV9CNP8_9ACTN